ncbi:MAG: hypothetical protein ACRDVE_03015 [Actinocrinis sp.]
MISLAQLVHEPAHTPWRPREPPPSLDLLRRVLAGLERLQQPYSPRADRVLTHS